MVLLHSFYYIPVLFMTVAVPIAVFAKRRHSVSSTDRHFWRGYCWGM